jgi:hypothetical protein
MQRAIITIILIGPLVAAGAVYAGLVNDGTVSPPDLAALARSAMPIATDAVATLLGLAILFMIACAVLAPLIFAARSGDLLTVVVSIVLTVVALGLLATARSVVHEVLAAVVYLANIVLTATVYGAHRIADARSANGRNLGLPI